VILDKGIKNKYWEKTAFTSGTGKTGYPYVED
jgi:hypothetical protein